MNLDNNVHSYKISFANKIAKAATSALVSNEFL